MATQRNHYSAEFKAKVALEALKKQQTLAQLGSTYGVHPTLVAQWKRQLREALPKLFADRRQKPDRSAEELQDQLYQQISQLKVELDVEKSRMNLNRIVTSSASASQDILWSGPRITRPL
jgi:transposase-like protein